MVCSSCGFENLKGMRFCGMCGTPLPFRPLTAPGAQSTLNLTRVPVETASLSRERATTSTLSRVAVLPAETRPLDGDGKSSPRVTASTAVEEPLELVAPEVAMPVEIEPPELGTPDVIAPVETEPPELQAPDAIAPDETEPAVVVEPPAPELVPDVPLDEYVQNFHYEPPSDSAEVTMRGDAPVAEQRLPVHTSSADVTEEEPVMSAANEEAQPVALSDAESRLGLEPEVPTEVTAERPRFLDLGEPATDDRPAASGTSTIVGPSFLGLSDAPEIADAELVESDEAPRKSHWRGWAAAAIVVIFAGLGWMEWRSQSAQTTGGPVEVIKTKVRNWTKGSTSQASNDAAPANASSDNNKPDMQVQEQPNAQPSQSATSPQPQAATSTPSTSGNATNNAAGSTGAQPGASAAAPAGTSTTPAPSVASNTQGQPAAQAPTPAASAPASGSAKTQTQAAAAKPKPDRKADVAADDAAPAKATPGSEELTKAKNASDSAAEAAWLWKSTAKGNPDAPVMLADMYIKGDGVPRSCEQAVVLLKTAAEKENARARNRLASMYASGNCVQRNRVEAYRWLSAALTANPHSDWALQNKDLLWQQMSPDERAEAAKYR